MDQIGKYEILDKIGSGGFAVVYKGYDPFIKRPVAIKVCYSRDEETRARFNREAEIAGRLVHRHITTVYDFGIHEQMPYLVEEYLPGEDLAHVIRRGEPETAEEKIEYLVQIASGLEHAHSQGVIHRDIKPSNIRVLDSGRVKIMDFGTAKMANVESNLTQTGMTLGTVAYLSPERLLGQDTGSVKSDIFSFGVLAYELLSFRRPFPGRSIPNLIDQVLNAAPVPLDESWTECPPDLAALVHRCLRKDPAERYESCTEIIRELEDLRTTTTTVTQVKLEPYDPNDVTRVSFQVSSLVERARQQLQRGKLQRVEVLLEEVLEMDPDNEEAKALFAECETKIREQEKGAAPPAGLAGEDPEERRRRKIAEAAHSIETYVKERELGQAIAALKFATQILGEFGEAPKLRTLIVSTLRDDLVALKSAAMRQARDVLEQMTKLHQDRRLDLEKGEHLHQWVRDLDPEHPTVAIRILDELRERQHEEQRSLDRETRSRKQAEAVASIEKLLAEGNPAMAEKALIFAERLLGEFEQIPALKLRIDEAQRQAGS